MSIHRPHGASPVNTAVKTLAAGSLLALALVGCTQIAPTPTPAPAPVPSDAPSAAPAATLDPLTCYIFGDSSIKAPAVVLQCGGGTAVTVDLTKASSSAELDLPVLDWVITSASRGTSDIGSSIVRVHATNGERSCVYERDMADDAETTTKTCR